jgi:hypothetical protein
LSVGDVFTIPLSEEEVGFGQIISFSNINSVFWMVIYDCKAIKSNNYDINKIFQHKILLLGYTNDAKLYHKHWSIIGTYIDNISSISMPYFKLGLPNPEHPDGARLVDYKGKVLAQIDKDVFDKLEYKTEVGPIRFENALKAYFGYGEWIPDDYDMLLYEKTLESVKIADQVLKRE